MQEPIHGIDIARVTAWLVEHIDGAIAPFEFDVIVGGRSNLTYTVTGADGTKYVLRRPPTGAVLATAHDMAREHKIITGVGKSSVPVPPALGLCTDEAVNGAPFYVMGFVDGVVLDGADKGALLTVENRRAAGLDLIDVLADLHAVDVDEVGLGDLAKREGYVERQVKRWSTQWERSKTRELPAVEEVARQLRLRNVGGLVVIDLIDMRSRKYQNAVYRLMKESLKRARARVNVLPISDLGIMEMTRQRVSESLRSTMYVDCPYCRGKGIVISPLGMSVNIQRQKKPDSGPSPWGQEVPLLDMSA